MKTRDEIRKEVRTEVIQKWEKTGPIDEYIGLFVDQEIVNRTEMEYQKQFQDNSKASRKSTQYDK